MKYFIRVAALLMLVSITFAFERDISWTPPTSYTNDAPLLEQELDYYTLFCDGTELVQLDSVVGTWTATIEFPDVPATYTCWLTTTTLLGVESAASNSNVFTYLPPTPMAPVVEW